MTNDQFQIPNGEGHAAPAGVSKVQPFPLVIGYWDLVIASDQSQSRPRMIGDRGRRQT
jgi:hypothetical protein